MRKFLADYASVGADGVYRPGGSSGYSVEPGGYAQAPVPLPPLPLDQLLSVAERAPTAFEFENRWNMQPTMLQPVGGMDRIPRAIFERVKAAVRLNTPATAIRRTGSRVRIEHRGGITEADYCVCTLRAALLSSIPSDFSAAKKAALRSVTYLDSVKLAFEAPRFWETDGSIYGGISWTDRLNENVVYPSGDFGARKGILVGAYAAGWTRPDNPEAFARVNFAERVRIARESVEALHPGKSHLLSKPVTVAWSQTPWQTGIGAVWSTNHDRGAAYAELLRPEGPIVFAGEHLSYLAQWQEGAALSAHAPLQMIAEMANGRDSRRSGTLR